MSAELNIPYFGEKATEKFPPVLFGGQWYRFDNPLVIIPLNRRFRGSQKEGEEVVTSRARYIKYWPLTGVHMWHATVAGQPDGVEFALPITREELAKMSFSPVNVM